MSIGSSSGSGSGRAGGRDGGQARAEPLEPGAAWYMCHVVVSILTECVCECVGDLFLCNASAVAPSRRTLRKWQQQQQKQNPKKKTS